MNRVTRLLVLVLALAGTLAFAGPSNAAADVPPPPAGSSMGLLVAADDSGVVHYGGLCLPGCQSAVSLQVVRGGMVVAAGTTEAYGAPVPESAALSVSLQPGDELRVSVNGAEVASVPAVTPTIEEVACRETVVEGSLDPGYTLLPPSDAFTPDTDGTTVPVTYAGSGAESGGRYAVTSPRPILPGDIAIFEAHTYPLQVAGFGSASLIATFGAHGRCGPNGPNRPRAACDVYWTPPNHTLVVPAAAGLLRNDVDPKGSPLTVHIDHISFGVSTHPYKVNRATGALTFTSSRVHGSSVAILTYHDTDPHGVASQEASVTILIQAESPPASRLRPCPRPVTTVPDATGMFDSLIHRCGYLQISEHKLPITRPGISGTLTLGVISPATNNLCYSVGAPKDTWSVKATAFARWKGTPNATVGIKNVFTINGSSFSVGFPPSLSVSSTSSSATLTASGTNYAADDFRTTPVTLSAVDSDHLTSTLQPEITFAGQAKPNLAAASAHVCFKFGDLSFAKIENGSHNC